MNNISNNTASGFDSVYIEHYKLAHPSIVIILKYIFNIFITFGEVPVGFGKGVVTPISMLKGC
jgi:hypothetical protein